MGLSWNATQLIIPVSFVEPVAREHNWNPAVLTDSAHTAEGEWTTEDWSSWLNDTKTRTWNALGKDRHQWKLNRRQVHPRLWAVSLFSQSVERNARDTRDLTRDWRRENASLVARVCSTLPRAFTPRTKINLKKKRVLLIQPNRPLPSPHAFTPYPPAIPISWNRDLLYLSSESSGFLYLFCSVLFCSKTHPRDQKHLSIPMRTKFADVKAS